MLKAKDALNDFISYLNSEKGASANTVEAYARDLHALIRYLKSRSIDDLTKVTSKELVGYLGSLKNAGYATASISRSIIAIKVFFRFMKREGHLKENISLYLETPKLWQRIPSVLTSQEIERILSEPDLTTTTGMRDRAILELLYSSGLRVSELCGLSIYSVDDNFVRVFGKGRKERLVPIGKPALKAIDEYLLHARGEHAQEEHLFLSSKGRPLDRITVWQMVKRYGAKAKIAKCISPHTFRHSFATHLLDNGADLRVIQEMLGHGNISSTDRYTHVSSAHLQKAFQHFHRRY